MQATDEVNEKMQELIIGIETIKAFNLQNFETKEFAKRNRKLTKIGQKSLFISELAFPIGALVMDVTSAAVLGFGALTKTVKITEVVALIQLVLLMMVGLLLFVTTIAQIGSSSASANRIGAVIYTNLSIQINKEGQTIENGEITFQNVDFQYQKNAPYVLKNINLQIQAGETIGIIGETGSGKTTLANLIARLNDPTNGEIRIDQKRIQDLTYDSMRDAIAFVPQKTTLFSGTIASNLQFGKHDANESEMEIATKTAEAYNFICAKPNKFETIVEQRGENFSGGQKQRLSIARAIINPTTKILVLDDATSALDALTEKAVQKNLKREHPD